MEPVNKSKACHGLSAKPVENYQSTFRWQQTMDDVPRVIILLPENVSGGKLGKTYNLTTTSISSLCFCKTASFIKCPLNFSISARRSRPTPSYQMERRLTGEGIEFTTYMSEYDNFDCLITTDSFVLIINNNMQPFG